MVNSTEWWRRATCHHEIKGTRVWLDEQGVRQSVVCIACGTEMSDKPIDSVAVSEIIDKARSAASKVE